MDLSRSVKISSKLLNGGRVTALFFNLRPMSSNARQLAIWMVCSVPIIAPDLDLLANLRLKSGG